MLGLAEPISKPLPCYQSWGDMVPVNGGRICTGCGKLVVDFRNHKWYEIEQAQRASIVPLCGIYDLKQIQAWGSEVTQPITGCSRIVRLSATLLAFAQIVPGNLAAQTNPPQHQVPASNQKSKQNPLTKSKSDNPTVKRIISGTVVAQVNDSTKIPVACAELSIVLGAKTIATETDSFGRFSLDLSNSYASLHDTFEIVVTDPRYSSHTIKCAKSDIKADQRNILDVVLADVAIVSRTYDKTRFRGEVYYAMPYRSPNPPQTNKPIVVKESKIKRWWRQLWKKDKK